MRVRGSIIGVFSLFCLFIVAPFLPPLNSVREESSGMIVLNESSLSINGLPGRDLGVPGIVFDETNRLGSPNKTIGNYALPLVVRAH